MTDHEKNRQQLLVELEEAHRTIAELKAALLVHNDRDDVHQNISDDSNLLTKPNQSLKKETDESRSFEEIAKKSEKSFLSFVELSTEGIWLFEVEPPVSTALPEDEQIELFYKHSYLVECNKTMAQMYGLSSPQEIIGARLGDLLIPTDANNLEYLRAFIRSGYNLTDAESHETDAEGNDKYFLNNLLGIVENGFVLRAWGTQRDLTEAKRINEALRASENRFRTLAETASDAIITIDEVGVMTFLNQAAEKIFGYSIAEMKGKDLTMLMPEYLRHLHQAGFTRYKETGKRHISWEATELLGLHKNGTEIPLQISFGEYVLNEKRFFTGIVRDITESKGAQALMLGQQVIMELVARGIRLEEVLEALALFIESQSEGMTCSIELVNEDAITMSLGAAPNLPDELIQAIDGLAITATTGSCGAAMIRKENVISSDIANDPLWADYLDKVLPHGFRACWSAPIFSKSGEVLGSFGMFYNRICAPREPDYKLMEISARLAGIAIDSHLAVVNLRASQERNKALLQAVPDWIFRYRKDGTYLDFNGQEEGLLFPPSVFLGKTVFQVHSEALAKQTFRRIEKTLQTGKIEHFEFKLLMQGEVRHYESRMAPSGTDEVVEIVRDITENKRGQSLQIGQQQILELIARDTPLEEVLEALALFIEAQSEGVICSIELVNEDAITMSLGAAPNLPDELIHMIEGMKITPTASSCGAAISRKEIVISSDIANDPLWVDFADHMLPRGFRACWSTPIFSKSGNVLGTFGMLFKRICAPREPDYKLMEISARLAGIAIDSHLAVVNLRASQERYRTLYENNPLMIFTVDAEGTILLVNEFGAQQLGYSATELIGKSGRMLFRKEDQLGARGQITKCLQDPTQLSQWEIPKVHKDGTTIWVKAIARAIKRADGKWAVLIVCEDITWRKLAEEALRESEQRYRMLFERNLAGVYRGKLDGTPIDCNEAYAQIFGYDSKEDFLTHTAFDVYFDLSERKTFTNLLVEKGSVTNFEVKLRKKDGSPVWVLLNVTLLEDSNNSSTIIEETAIDITERKLAEEALRESESKFRAVAESTASAMTIHRNGNLLYVNPATERISGYSKEELLHMNLAQILHPDSIQLYLERTRARERGEPIPLETEYKIICKDGEERWMDFTFGGFVNIDSLPAIIGTAYDITDRKRAEELLIAEKERLSVTLRSIGDGVIATNTEGKIILLNRVAENLTGWKQEEALGKRLNEVFQIINAKTREPRQSSFEQVFQSGEGGEFEDHTALIAKDGAELIVADSIAPIYDKESKIIGLVLVFRDLAEELKREEEILRAGKLESIALLAGGIAHDFNNILTAIMGNLSLTKRFIDPENQAYKRLHEAEQATWRAKDLTQQLLTFSSGGAPIKKTASVAQLLQESLKFALTGSNVKGDIYLQEDLWLTEIDEGQINQVIHNLVLNARQAMPLGGTIEVRAENILLKHGSTIQGAYLAPNKYVRITVKDPGTGMSEEHLRKIFDPYFTTKQKGSGLGLATSYSIIKNHSGYLFVESELGVGTTFSIYLLASQKMAVKKIDLEAKPLSGKGKILIMDDEPVLRKMIADMLDYLGYQSDTSANGNQAIELYRQEQEAGAPFDAVILDLTVPGGMGGAEAAEKLLALDPHARCIVSSGYSTDPIMAEYKDHGFVAVIAKPYQIAELNDVLSRVISDPSEEN